MKATKKSKKVKITDLKTRPGKGVKGGISSFNFMKKVDK
jgi:hypothetical protein